MSGLQVYVDFLSQPSRAILLFLKANNIQHQVNYVSIQKGEQKSEDYKKKVNPFGKVPAINDRGFKLVESIAILRYLARTYPIADHWYPTNTEAQAKVDEFLEWHHLGLRFYLGSFFLNKVVKPLLLGVTPDEAEVENSKKGMESALDVLETVWLKEKDYVCGDTITIADLIALCEVDQTRAAGFDPTTERPNIRSWLYRIRKDLSPHYNEVTSALQQFVKSSVLSRFPGAQ